jgi:hypothetical protein
MLGKLTWAAIPFDQPIPLFAAGLVGLTVIFCVLVYVTLKAGCRISGGNGSPASIPSGSA